LVLVLISLSKAETPAKHYLKAENYRNILSNAAAGIMVGTSGG
jgi:hypothetical protein